MPIKTFMPLRAVISWDRSGACTDEFCNPTGVPTVIALRTVAKYRAELIAHHTARTRKVAASTTSITRVHCTNRKTELS